MQMTTAIDDLNDKLLISDEKLKFAKLVSKILQQMHTVCSYWN